MVRIEFFGVPGVGKSATYSALTKFNSSKKYWLSSSEARLIAIKNMLKKKKANSYREKMVNQLRCLVLKSKPLYTTFNFGESLLKTNRKQLFATYAKEHSAFIEACAGSFAETNKEPSRRFIGAYWFFEKVCEIAFLEKYLEEKIVLYDEGLAQKVFGITDATTPEAIIKATDYFKNMPKPTAIVLFSATHDLLEKRLKGRKKTLLAHDNIENFDHWIAGALEVYEAGKKVISARGIQLIELEAEMSITDKVSNIEKFINKLQAERN